MNTLTIINTRTCTVPISVFIGTPYSLPWGSSIWATVQAVNIIGNGPVSAGGNGALIL